MKVCNSKEVESIGLNPVAQLCLRRGNDGTGKSKVLLFWGYAQLSHNVTKLCATQKSRMKPLMEPQPDTANDIGSIAWLEPLPLGVGY